MYFHCLGILGNNSENLLTMSKKVVTLSDVKKDTNDKKRQTYDIGGGQQVLGPKKSTKDDEFISKLFERAREHGAAEVDANENQPTTSTSASSSQFTDTNETSGSTVGSGQESGPVRLKIQLWQNGFVTDDGQLRNYEDPENRQFLESIMQNRIPQELLSKYKGAPVEIDLVKRSHEQYKPSANVKTQQPFQGQGHFLGSPIVPSVKSNEEAFKTLSIGQVHVNVDESKPTTRIQIRLADGTRLFGRFNFTHRISDIRQFIVDMNPASNFTPFVLMTNYPKKELTDESKTLQEADLINIVIFQLLKP